MQRAVQYCLAISNEILGDNAPVPFQGNLEKSFMKARDMGYDGVELHIREPNKINLNELNRIVQSHQIKITAIGTGLEYTLNGLSLTSPDPLIREKMAKRLMEHIDLAAQFNAVVFLGLCRGKSPDFQSRAEYLSRMVREILPLCKYASRKGVVLAFEPIAFYLTNLLNTTTEVLEFLKEPGLQDIQLLLDTHHMFVEDQDMEKSLRMCKGRIAHFHISDSNRRYPGGGKIDYHFIGRILEEIGYDRTVSLEVLPYPSGEQAALKGIEWMRSIWGIL